MNRLRYEVGTLATWGLALSFGAFGSGCDKSSEGTEPPAASASASASPAAEPAASAAASAQPAAAAAPDDQAGAGDDYADDDPSAVTDFKPVLDPHGTWKEDPKFGSVWVPATAAVGANFVPYQTGGHWVYDDVDYVWVSDYDWGWAPFHYGRWAFMEGTGWGWIPGRVYSPAWVNWRVGAPGFGYVGWGPMAPTWGWRGGVVSPFGFAVDNRWSYCATGDLFNRGLSGRVLSGPRVGAAEAGTKPWSGEGAGGGSHGHTPGPAPGKIGVKGDQVAHPSPNDPGLSKAKGFSKPSTAAAQGGHPPTKPATKAPNGDKGKPGEKPALDKPAEKAPGEPSPAGAKDKPPSNNLKTPEPAKPAPGKPPAGGKKEK